MGAMFCLDAETTANLIDRYEAARKTKCEETTALEHELGWRVHLEKQNCILPLTRNGIQYRIDSLDQLVRTLVRSKQRRAKPDSTIRAPRICRVALDTNWKGVPVRSTTTRNRKAM